MKLLTCICTYNRLEYTKRCVSSWQATSGADDGLVIVDNASTDGTRDELAPMLGRYLAIENNDNLFPGMACNQGWTAGLHLFPEATHLHRSDNDIEYLPGWRQEVEAAFERHPSLALLGLLNLHEDHGVQWPDGELGDIDGQGAVGGNVVMPRRLWDAGLRWSEVPWGPGGNEDARMSDAAQSYGQVAQLRRTVANNMAYGRYADYPAYYDATAAARGIADAAHSV